MGHNTGLKIVSLEIFKQFPADRYSGPLRFVVRALNVYVDLLVKTGCINDGKKIWWDCRHRIRFFPDAVNFAFCDIPTRVDDTIAIAGLSRRLLARLTRLIEKNLGFRLYRAC